MKHLLAILIAAAMLTACGDTTTINGYSDEQVEKLLEANKDTIYQVNDGDSILTYIYVTDTLYTEIVDTVYKMSVDTLYQTLYDTLTTTITDTIVNTLVDTITTRVIDTVINTMVDTVYTRVIDTVFKTLETIGVDTDMPKDTTIVLYDTTEGTITAKFYAGVVFKNTFYEAKEYQLAKEMPTVDASFSFSTSVNGVQEVTVSNYAWEMNCSGACGIRGNVYVTALCGTITQPDYMNFAYKTTQIKRFDGWRVFDAEDAYKMAPYLNQIVSDTTLVYLSTVLNTQNGVNTTFTANVAKYNVPSMVSQNKDKYSLKYVCAYDLK